MRLKTMERRPVQTDRVAGWIDQMWLPALVVLALVTFGINMYNRAAWPFWPDEAYTVLQVRSTSWGELIRVNLANEETPPLYFVLLRAWSLLWGRSDEATLRMFSALALALAVPLLGWLGALVWNRQVGLGASLLLAVNPFAHHYGQETRAYSLALFFATVVLIAGWRYLERPQFFSWLIFVAAGAALLYTNYFGAFVLLALGLYGGFLLFGRWWSQKTPRLLWPFGGWVAAQAAILAVFLPWLPGVRYQVLVSSAALAPENRSLATQFLASLLALGANFPDGSRLSMLLIMLICLALVVALGRVVWHTTHLQKGWLLAIIVIPMLCAIAMLAGDGQFNPRYVFLTMPGYLLLISVGLIVTGRFMPIWRGLFAALVGVSLMYALTLNPRPQRLGHWDDLARTVAQQARPGDGIFFAPAWCKPAFDIQYQGAALAEFGAESFAQYYYEGKHLFTEQIDLPVLESYLASQPRAWVVQDSTYARVKFPPTVRVIQHEERGSTALFLVEQNK